LVSFFKKKVLIFLLCGSKSLIFFGFLCVVLIDVSLKDGLFFLLN
jgi:hypothetical protein